MKMPSHINPNFMSRKRRKEELAALSEDVNSLFNLQKAAERSVKEKNYELCLEILNQIKELFGPTSDLLLNEALVLYRLNEIEYSIISLQESLELDPNNENTILLLAKLRDKLNNLRRYTMSIYG